MYLLRKFKEILCAQVVCLQLGDEGGVLKFENGLQGSET